MKYDKSFFLRIAMIITDVLAVVFSLFLAYYFRINFDSRLFYFEAHTINFLIMAISFVPIWLVVNRISGLYDRAIYLYRPREYGRVFIASIITIMALITFGYFADEQVFPARIIPVYFVIINFMTMIAGRELVRILNRMLLRGGIGRNKVLLVGSNSRSTELAEFFINNIDYGYDLIGMVSKPEFLPKKDCPRHFASFKEAISKTKPEIIIHTDNLRSEEIYNFAIEKHISYMFVPQQDRLLSQLNTVEIVGGLPIIDIKVTKLFGIGQFYKRAMDLILGVLGLILASPVMILVAILMKITAPRESIFFRQVRLTRFNREFYIYKFRSQKAEFDGLTPEEAFEKMGKPELSKIYRQNGDQLKDDPRVTKIGKFLRASSIDELPQLFNVVRGDISLVGPRALIPQEINQHKKKDIILAVKSGVTGLAQVSGRRDISFEERRRLDVYYVQNWSILLDIQILFKTVASVLFRRGAK
ncbi:MAG: exopolysaccharide biosynthesis polyprenyl glycosylphosphotransferase [bacterium]|nr:exopolysaccharide biosynthesis polyprenyl glycosylphosphotransferase [bacterium]